MVEVLCAICGQAIDKGNCDYLICSFGGCILHFNCSGVTETAYNNLNQRRKNHFKCLLCLKNKKISNQVSHFDYGIVVTFGLQVGQYNFIYGQ